MGWEMRGYVLLSGVVAACEMEREFTGEEFKWVDHTKVKGKERR